MPLFTPCNPVFRHKLLMLLSKNDPLRKSGESFLLALAAQRLTYLPQTGDVIPGMEDAKGKEDNQQEDKT